MAIHNIEEIIEDIRQGKMVVMMDDEDRENEGDVIMAAEKITHEHVNFMARFARGLICLPLSEARCQALGLPLMVADNHSKFGTNFTVSIEAAHGVTTGISAQDRAQTILTAVKTENRQEIVQPGHIFPIMAQQGGVLMRAGHTEAGVDLAKLAGLKPAAVLCEILNEDGTMARRLELEQFASLHGLKLGTIADLIRYRLTQETTIKEISRQPFVTDFGFFDQVVFEDVILGQHHVAYVYGHPQKSKPASVKISHDRWGIEEALHCIAKEGVGAVVVLGQMPYPVKTESAQKEWRLIGVGSQILSVLGFGRIRLLGTKKHYCALSGFGLEVVEYRSREVGIEMA